ncbi:hypothetical protein CYMTET_46814 [Cymbomonas tetramitiformis]|uniref:Uncharacterized protein n=1 Tax=Cymbomonas tetramitiformis TaxID=36881 RepID=A0AAE0BVG0_9CHLO|nr:hypothetical protein CYMTET_46814 [Cymbomonas tetramitiformis]
MLPPGDYKSPPPPSPSPPPPPSPSPPPPQPNPPPLATQSPPPPSPVPEVAEAGRCGPPDQNTLFVNYGVQPQQFKLWEVTCANPLTEQSCLAIVCARYGRCDADLACAWTPDDPSGFVSTYDASSVSAFEIGDLGRVSGELVVPCVPRAHFDDADSGYTARVNALLRKLAAGSDGVTVASHIAREDAAGTGTIMRFEARWAGPDAPPTLTALLDLARDGRLNAEVRREFAIPDTCETEALLQEPEVVLRPTVFITNITSAQALHDATSTQAIQEVVEQVRRSVQEFAGGYLGDWQMDRIDRPATRVTSWREWSGTYNLAVSLEVVYADAMLSDPILNDWLYRTVAYIRARPEGMLTPEDITTLFQHQDETRRYPVLLPTDAVVSSSGMLASAAAYATRLANDGAAPDEALTRPVPLFTDALSWRDLVYLPPSPPPPSPPPPSPSPPNPASPTPPALPPHDAGVRPVVNRELLTVVVTTTSVTAADANGDTAAYLAYTTDIMRQLSYSAFGVLDRTTVDARTTGVSLNGFTVDSETDTVHLNISVRCGAQSYEVDGVCSTQFKSAVLAEDAAAVIPGHTDPQATYTVFTDATIVDHAATVVFDPIDGYAVLANPDTQAINAADADVAIISRVRGMMEVATVTNGEVSVLTSKHCPLPEQGYTDFGYLSSVELCFLTCRINLHCESVFYDVQSRRCSGAHACSASTLISSATGGTYRVAVRAKHETVTVGGVTRPNDFMTAQGQMMRPSLNNANPNTQLPCAFDASEIVTEYGPCAWIPVLLDSQGLFTHAATSTGGVVVELQSFGVSSMDAYVGDDTLVCAETAGVQPVTGLDTGEECAAYLSNSMDLNYAHFLTSESGETYCFLTQTCIAGDGMRAFGAFASGTPHKLRSNGGVRLDAAVPSRTFSKAQLMVGHKLEDAVAPERPYSPRSLSASSQDSGDYEKALEEAMAPTCVGGLINPEPYDNANAFASPTATRICINAMCGVYGEASYVGDRKRETQCQTRTDTLHAMDVQQVECCADTQYVGLMRMCAADVPAPCLLPDTLTAFGEDYTPVAQYMHGSAGREVEVVGLVDDVQPALTSIRVDVQERADYDNYTEIVLAVETASDALASVVRHGGQPMTANARDTTLIVARRSVSDVASVSLRTGLGPFPVLTSAGYDITDVVLRAADSELRDSLRDSATTNGVGLVEATRNSTLVISDAAADVVATLPIVKNASADAADGHRFADAAVGARLFVPPKMVGGTSTQYSMDTRSVRVPADKPTFDLCFATCATNQPISLGARTPVYFSGEEAAIDGATSVTPVSSDNGVTYFHAGSHAVRDVSSSLSPAAELGPDASDLTPVYVEVRSVPAASTKRERVAVRTVEGGHTRRQGVACVTLQSELASEGELTFAVQEAVAGVNNLQNGGCASKTGAAARSSSPEMTLPYMDGALSGTSAVIASSVFPSLVFKSDARLKLSDISTHVMNLWGARGGDDHATDDWLVSALRDVAIAAESEADMVELLTDLCGDVKHEASLQLADDAASPCMGFTFETTLNPDKLRTKNYGGFCMGPIRACAPAAAACSTYLDKLFVFQGVGLYLAPSLAGFGEDERRRQLLSTSTLTVSVGAAQVAGLSVLQVTGADPIVGCPAQCGAPARYGASGATRTIYYHAGDSATGGVTYMSLPASATGYDASGGSWPYVLVAPGALYELTPELAASGQITLGTTPVGDDGYAALTINGLPAYQFVSDTGSTSALGATMPGGWGAFRSDGTPIGDGMTASPTATAPATPAAVPAPPPLAPGEVAFPKADGTDLIAVAYPDASLLVNDAATGLRELLPTDGRRVTYATDEVVDAINGFAARRIQNVSEQTHVTNVLNGAFTCGPVTATLTTDDASVSPTTTFNMDVSVPRTGNIDGSDVLSSRVDIVFAQSSSAATEVRMNGYTATVDDKYAFIGQCRSDSDPVDFYVADADDFYHNRYACGAAAGTIDWQINPDAVAKNAAPLPTSPQCESGNREFRLTATLAQLMGTSESNGHHPHVVREQRAGGVYAYAWTAYIAETVTDAEGLSYTRESKFDFEVTLKGLAVSSVSSVGTQLPSAVSDVVSVSARGVPATLATHVEFEQEICVAEPRATDAMHAYIVVDPIESVDLNRATQSLMHPDRAQWGYPVRGTLSDGLTPTPGYEATVKYVTQREMSNPVSHLTRGDELFDYAPEVQCRIANFAPGTSYGFNDTAGLRRVSSLAGVNLANSRFGWNCFTGYYVCVVPVLTSEALHLRLQTNYLVSSGGLYRSSIANPAHVVHAQSVLVTGIAQNATMSFDIAMQLRKLQITEDDESLSTGARRRLMGVRGVGTSTWSELVRNLYTEPFVDRAESFYSAGALSRIEVGRPFALNVFLNDAQSRSRYFLRPVSMLALLRKRESGEGPDFSTSGQLRSEGGPLTSVATDMCGSVTSAGDGGDLLNTSKLIRIYGPVFTKTPAAHAREVASFYTPLLAPIDDNLQSSIFDRDLIQYLRTPELYASDELLSKFLWANDYRGGLHFASGSNTWFLRNGLDFSTVDPDVRYDLLFCYHGQAIPKAEAGELDNSADAVAYRNAAGNPPASTATSRRMLGVPVTAGFVQPGPGLSGRALLQALAPGSQDVAPNAMSAVAELVVAERIGDGIQLARVDEGGAEERTTGNSPPPAPPPSPPSPPPSPPSPPPSPRTDDDDDDGDGAMIASIVVSCFVAAVIVAGSLYLVLTNRKQRSNADEVKGS